MHLSNLIRGAHRCVEDFIAQRVKASGLSVEQYRILAALHDSDGRSMSSLATTVFVDSPTMTKIVDRMVTSSLVYRAPDSTDRRKVLIYKAQKGAQVFKSLSSIETELQSHLEQELGRSDLEHLMGTLHSILESTQADDAPALAPANLGSIGAAR
ncbi:MarR family winged helix-turn-helix transcriptional regulator [Acidimangrovimonas sediminis]|uniref:MarR family winged helix-turn-helix transcriptional regulator n=1 Tax=Acidimangrovimonas sediminis TaxID=2056283 RepID=UPI000C7FFC8F|nr:MarR family transcriptional regulator [Acidimangrovimonas sediminis]